MRARSIVGVAAARGRNNDQIQVCHGTLLGDLPDARLRLAVHQVTHDGDFPLHGHQYTELVLVTGGTASHVTGDGERQLSIGDVLVLHGPQQHGFRLANRLELCNIQFDPRTLLSADGLQDLPDFARLFCADRPVHRHLEMDQLQGLLSLSDLLETELRQDAPGREVAARGLFHTFIARLCRSLTQADTSPTCGRLAPLFAHIQAHLSERLPVTALARITDLSPSQLQRVVRQATGTSLVGYLTRARVAAACRLLTDTSLGIAEIAARSGFRSPAFFTARFRAIIGTTPTAYRRQVTRVARAG